MVKNVSKPKTKTYKSFKKYTKKSTYDSNFNNKVIKVLNKNAEKKHLNMNPLEYTWNAVNSTMSASINLASQFNIGIGTTDGTRVGNTINCTKCVLCMNLATLSSNTSFGPFIVSVYVGTLRKNPSFVPTPTDFTKFLQDGVTSTFQDGSTLSLLRNINKDYFNVHHMQRIKIGPSNGNPSVTKNNDFPAYVNRKISLKKMLGKHQYDDDTGSGSSKNLFMWCQVTNINSSSVSAADCPVLSYYLDVEYVDF